MNHLGVSTGGLIKTYIKKTQTAVVHTMRRCNLSILIHDSVGGTYDLSGPGTKMVPIIAKPTTMSNMIQIGLNAMIYNPLRVREKWIRPQIARKRSGKNNR